MNIKTVEEKPMIYGIRKSKYNYMVYDENGNLVIYNFLRGLGCVAKIESQYVEKFERVFISSECDYDKIDASYQTIADQLLRLGILVSEEVNENEAYKATHYQNAFDNQLQLTVLPTGKCMFRCPYCYECMQKFHREAMTPEKQKALLSFVKKSISNHTSLKIGWYGGEPLMEYDTIKYLSETFIKICNMRHIPYVAEMTTNAFLLTEDVFDTLYKLRVYTYMITLDGFKEQHDKIRFTSDGKGSFDTILKNLLYIRDNKHYKFAHVIVRINVSSDVLERLDELVEFVADLFSGDPRFEINFAAVVSYTPASKYGKFVDPFKMYDQLFKNETYMEKIYSEKSKVFQLIPEQKCIATKKNAFVITPDLSVYKCYSFFENKNNKVGYIDDRGILNLNEALHNKWYLGSDYMQPVSQECQDCFYRPCCRVVSSGCPLRYVNKQKWQVCALKTDGFKDGLRQNILYAASHYPINTIKIGESAEA